MTFKKLEAVFLILVWGLACHANAASVDEAALKRASERGVEIFLLDEAGWVSTDEMLRKLPDPRAAGVSGWIVEKWSDHLRSTFYGLRNQRPVALFVVDTRGREVISSQPVAAKDSDGLTEIERLMIQAREVAARQTAVRCTEGPLNTVVIPPRSADEPTEVYMLSSQVKQDEYPLGGHQLFRIDPKGSVLSQRKFTNGCLNMSRTPNVAGLVVSHLLDTTPTEIHVFTSKAARMPVFVVAPVSLPPDPKSARIWKVDGEVIAVVREDAQ